MKKFIDYSFSSYDRVNNPEGEAIASFNPEVIAAAIEELGYQHAQASKLAEQAKHDAERTFAELVQGFRKVAGSVSGAEAMAKSDPVYQDKLAMYREAEFNRAKAQSSFKATDSYSRMILTKVSSEAKIGEYYKKNLVT